MTKDLTQGKPETVLWQFCLPLFGSILFQQLYNIADSLVAGKFIGEGALAAVGNSYEVTLIFLAFAFGCNIGCSVVVSRYFGAKDMTRMKTAISTAAITSGITCLTLMVLGFLSSRVLLRAIHTPQEVFADSALYLDIYLLGLPFLFFYNIANGIFSAMGDSHTPFRFLAVSSLSNIAMDIFFVRNLHMGISGVAWATFLCQGFSCVAAVGVLLRRLGKLEHGENPAVFSGELLREFGAIAIPSMLQQSFVSVGNIIIQGQINSFGQSVMAGYSAGVKLNNLVITSFTTLGNGISNFAAQNLGAGRYHRIRDGFTAGIKMVWTLSLPLTLLYFFGGSVLLRLFLEDGAGDAAAHGLTFLKILSPFYFVVSAKLVSDGILRGMGRMRAFMAATFADLILRVVLAIAFSHTALGATGIWCAWPVGWTIATVLSVWFYRRSIGNIAH